MAQDQPEAGTRLTAIEIHDNILVPAEKEIERPALALLISAFASGLAIGFSFLAAAFVSHLVEGDRLKVAAAAAAYPLGFIFVIMARCELFTENTLTPVVPFLERRDRQTFLKLLRMWGLLLAGNLAGTVIFGWVLASTPVVAESLRPALDELARQSTSGTFGQIVYGGIYAGWLIALLAWLLAATRDSWSQIALIWLCTAPIHAFEFRHSIAGSVEAFYRAVGGDAPWGEMLSNFVVASVLGNAIGGVLLVAILNYGQVAAERRGRGRKKGGG